MVGGVKDKIMSLSKSNATKNYSKPTRINNVHGDRKKLRKKSKDKIIKGIENRIIKAIRNLFERKGRLLQASTSK